MPVQIYIQSNYKVEQKNSAMTTVYTQKKVSSKTCLINRVVFIVNLLLINTHGTPYCICPD